jgi:hypothetical protein
LPGHIAKTLDTVQYSAIIATSPERGVNDKFPVPRFIFKDRNGNEKNQQDYRHLPHLNSKIK